MTPPINMADGLSDQVKFLDIGESLRRIPEVVRTIPDVLREPASNPAMAALLVGIISVLLLIVLVTIMLFIMRPDVEDLPVPEGAQGVGGQPAVTRSKGPSPAVILVIFAVFGVLWVAAGWTSGDNSVCVSCHQGSVHASATNDPHASTRCVSCHEQGGAAVQLTVGLPGRVVHLVQGKTNPAAARRYGSPISSTGCVTCHREQIAKTTTDEKLGLIVSHSEPLAAGAQCVDCHALVAGAVTAQTIGMSTCLRCHDGKKAQAICSECHVADPSQAIRAKNVERTARVLIPTPDCGACHFDQRRCDSCHGMRMPHSQEFILWGHARQGVVALWDNGGAPCNKCHTADRRPCTKCHQPFLQHPPLWKQAHQGAAWGNSCSCHRWDVSLHNGMNFCQVCHPVKPKGAWDPSTTQATP
ncbi:MAG: hypothetical protein WCI74_03930 [Actinomycetes bacterium]